MKNGPYVLIIPPQNYPGKRYRGKYAYEHRVNWWKKTGLNPDKIKGLQIHHENENKHDNSPSNLKEIDIVDHTKLHNPIKLPIKLTCEHCGIEFFRKVRPSSKQKKFCSRRCIGLFGFAKKDKADIWNLIKKYVEQGLSDYKIAEITGIHRSTVQRIRNKNE